MDNKTKRVFIIGDEWLYLKLYTGVKTADFILTNHFKDLLNRMIESKHIDHWFFIRYSDPDFHLRIRLHCVNKFKLMDILNSINVELNELINLNLIWKVQVDTYNRELERYGFDVIEETEKIFYSDSKMIVESLDLFEESKDRNLRWLSGLMIIDTLMNDFGLSIFEKKDLIENLKVTFSEEFRVDKKIKKQLSDKYQNHKQEIYKFLSKDSNGNKEAVIIRNFLKIKSITIKSEIESIKNSDEAVKNIENLISSHIHMSMNRLFRNRNRQAEFVCYQILFYYYESIIARVKYDKIIKVYC